MLCPLLGHSHKERVDDWQKLWKYRRIIICLGLADDLVSLYCFYRGPEFSSHITLVLGYSMFLSGLFAHLHWETPLSPPPPIPDPVPEKICHWQLLPTEMFKIMPIGYLICSPDLPCGSTSWVSLFHLGSPRNVLLWLNLDLLVSPDLIYYIGKET